MGTKHTPQKSSATGKRQWRAKFLAALCKIPNVSVACQAARIGRRAAYDARNADKDFAAAWEEAAQRGVEALEQECWRRAKNGCERGVWKQNSDGNPVEVERIREYSDTLAIFLLKAHAPDKYRETVRSELSGPGGRPIAVEQTVKKPIDFDELRRATFEVCGLPATNGNGQSVHSPHTNGKASNGAGHN